MIDAESYKTTMRQLAAGVIVITTELDRRVHAMTATAFSPLSLDPPMVLVCVHRENDTHRALRGTDRFGINFLSDAQSALATRFAGKSPARYNFSDVPRFLSPRGVTLLSNCAAALEVERAQTVEAGDHSIFIARVLWSQVQAHAQPLVYFKGGYQRVHPLLAIAAGATGT